MRATAAPLAPSAPPPAVERLGRVGYRTALHLQRRRVAERARDAIGDTLLLVRHPPVVTLGRSGDRRHVLASEAELAARGIEVVASDRGGDVTFHGPGQIVGYPIVDLARRGRDLHRYLRDLEEVLLRGLAAFGLAAGRQPGLTGVWVGDAKIAAIGIRVSRWVAHHGFALNVDPDLSAFDLIVPCGLTGRRVTSMRRELGRAVNAAPVEDALERAFLEIFGSPAEGAA